MWSIFFFFFQKKLKLAWFPKYIFTLLIHMHQLIIAQMQSLVNYHQILFFVSLRRSPSFLIALLSVSQLLVNESSYLWGCKNSICLHLAFYLDAGKQSIYGQQITALSLGLDWLVAWFCRWVSMTAYYILFVVLSLTSSLCSLS